MIQFKKIILIFFLPAMLLSACGDDDAGCTDPFSDNYDRSAVTDDGSCIPWTAKYEGNWIYKEACDGGNTFAPVPVYLSAGISPDEIGIFRRSDNSRVFNLKLKSTDSFDIVPYTYLALAGIIEVTGGGVMNKNRRSISIQTRRTEILGTNLVFNCNISIEKQ